MPSTKSNPELEVFKCPVPGCKRKYQIFGWLKNHAAIHHNLKLTPKNYENEASLLTANFAAKKTQPAIDPKYEYGSNIVNDHTEAAEDDNEEKEYCYCRETYSPLRPMIGCDGCDEWFHASCLGMTGVEMDAIEVFFCAECRDRDRYLSILYKGEPKRPCANAQCGQHTGDLSKYCSHKCGLVRTLVLARAAVRNMSTIQKMSNRVDSGEARNDHSEVHRIEAITALKKQKLSELEALTTVAQTQDQEQTTDTLTAVGCLSEKQASSFRGESEDCPVCGQSLPLKSYSRHVYMCTLKAEELQVPESIYSSREYLGLKGDFCQDQGRHYTTCTHPATACPLHGPQRKLKSARDAVCGYTGITGDSPPCQAVKCTRHHGWDIVRRGHIARECFIKKAELVALEDEESRLKISIGARHNPFNNLFHRTADHEHMDVREKVIVPPIDNAVRDISVEARPLIIPTPQPLVTDDIANVDTLITDKSIVTSDSCHSSTKIFHAEISTRDIVETSVSCPLERVAQHSEMALLQLSQDTTCTS